MIRILTLFGTRPELIKLAPVIRALESRSDRFESRVVCSSQHTDLLAPFLARFRLRVDHDLAVMRTAQTPDDVAARVLVGLQPVMAERRPEFVLVQGDTTTALAGALCAFHHKVPVGHVEAGLRSGDAQSPFPEEMNRRLISQLATLHFAATKKNVATLRDQGIDPDRIVHTGNPVVDALQQVLLECSPGDTIRRLVEEERGRRLLVLTTHRREAFGGRMAAYLTVLRRFVESHPDVALAFPVHPNPAVRDATHSILADVPRVHLLPPLDHPDFVHLIRRAWLVVSDSGGVQEEVATLGKPLLILRDNTERPEVLDAGIARLVGPSPERLAALLAEAAAPDSWASRVATVENPFGDGRSGARIVDAIERWFRKDAIVA